MGNRILVLHRNDRIRNLIREMLQDAGYDVTPAPDRPTALARAASEHFDLIVVDRTLAGDLDGARFVERLHRSAAGTPIITSAPEAAWEPSPEWMAFAID